MEPHTLSQADFSRLMGDAEFSRAITPTIAAWAIRTGLIMPFQNRQYALAATGPTPELYSWVIPSPKTGCWGDPDLCSDESVNRGIGGQTAPQMLVRFRADVVALRPRVVHIMAGTNDIAGNSGPKTMQDYKNTIMSRWISPGRMKSQ